MTVPHNADYVTRLRLGDRFRWCDRAVTLRSVIPATNVKRPGRYLVVTEDDGTEHRLHYYDDEPVYTLSPNDGSEGTP
jgi:hypothetical protein